MSDNSETKIKMFTSGPIDYFTGIEFLPKFIGDLIINLMPDKTRWGKVGRFLIPNPPCSCMEPVYICKADNNGTMYYFSDMDLEHFLPFADIDEIEIDADKLSFFNISLSEMLDPCEITRGNEIERVEQILHLYYKIINEIKTINDDGNQSNTKILRKGE